MKFDDKKIKDILLAGNYLTSKDIKKGEKESKEQNVSFVDYLLSNSLITKDLLGQAIAEDFKVNYLDLNSNQPSHEQILKIPELIAKKFRVVLFLENKKEITIATDNPSQEGLTQELEKTFPNLKVIIGYSLPDDIEACFVHYQKSLDTRFSKIIAEQKRIAPEIIDEILEDAFVYRASDIHFEPREKEVLVRFRVDGVLQEAGKIPKEYYENILNRIKVQSRLRIDEHFAAQDGSIRYEKNNHTIDLRTSIIPTIDGEKVVLRVLTSYIQGFGLGELGLTKGNQEILEKAAQKPFGMILVTGPTGSGKTTTLYAVLKMLNRSGVNITTIEDPVEYKIVGANQIQVNNQTSLTFVNGLRSIVRQDPDIILVGEIRDEETAEIAVNAALTGHLLLSTFHANDAATSIPRLLDMGIEPFLLASTLEIIMAQRLVRLICEQCRYSINFTKSEFQKKWPDLISYFPDKNITLYQGKGCPACGFTGYKSRTAIFEFIKITPELENLILKNPSTQEIWRLARSQGAISLFEDGIEKIKRGITTIEELLRVAAPPSDDIGQEKNTN